MHAYCHKSSLCHIKDPVTSKKEIQFSTSSSTATNILSRLSAECRYLNHMSKIYSNLQRHPNSSIQKLLQNSFLRQPFSEDDFEFLLQIEQN